MNLEVFIHPVLLRDSVKSREFKTLINFGLLYLPIYILPTVGQTSWKNYVRKNKPPKQWYEFFLSIVVCFQIESYVGITYTKPLR
jgi:hypothetical protein